MTRKPIDQLGDLQRAVLEAVWQIESGTVQQVIDQLKPKRKPAYTTVLTTLQNLTKAGWVKHTKQGRAYIYSATKTRQQANAKSITAFVKRAFDGDLNTMFQTLLDEDQISDSDLVEIRKMIDKKRREKKS